MPEQKPIKKHLLDRWNLVDRQIITPTDSQLDTERKLDVQSRYKTYIKRMNYEASVPPGYLVAFETLGTDGPLITLSNVLLTSGQSQFLYDEVKLAQGLLLIPLDME